MATIPQIFKDKLTPTQIKQVNDIVCIPLGLQLNAVLAVMYFETSKTFSTSITNSIGSVGLIQFTRDKAGVNYKTIGGKKYFLSDIKNMSFAEQLILVREYFRPYAYKINNFMDTYFAVFFPNAIGQPDNYLFQTSGLSASVIAQQNPIFDKDYNSKIFKSEVTNFFKGYYESFFSIINVNSKKKNMETLKTWIVSNPLTSFLVSMGAGVLVAWYFCKKK